MKSIKVLLIGIILAASTSASAQMFGTLTLPGLGGGTNAHAATYSGDGVMVGVSGLFSHKLNATIGAVVWNTGWDVIGGKYTMSFAQPILFDGNFKNHFYPVTVISPTQVSWDLNNLKLQGNYSLLYGQDLPLNGHLFTTKASYYINDGNYSINGSAIYEYRKAKKIADREYGDAMAFEGNFSKHFKNSNTIGVFGYYNSNVTPEYVGQKEVFNANSSVAGVGLDSNLAIGSSVFLNAKYIYDISKNKAIRANKLVVSVFYKF